MGTCRPDAPSSPGPRPTPDLSMLHIERGGHGDEATLIVTVGYGRHSSTRAYVVNIASAKKLILLEDCSLCACAHAYPAADCASLVRKQPRADADRYCAMYREVISKCIIQSRNMQCPN